MTHTGSDWGGRAAGAWSAAVLEAYGRDCWLRLPGCTGVATTADHVKSRRERPDLAHVVENGRPACLPCNSKRRDLPVELLHTIGGRSPQPVDSSSFFDA